MFPSEYDFHHRRGREKNGTIEDSFEYLTEYYRKEVYSATTIANVDRAAPSFGDGCYGCICCDFDHSSDLSIYFANQPMIWLFLAKSIISKQRVGRGAHVRSFQASRGFTIFEVLIVIGRNFARAHFSTYCGPFLSAFFIRRYHERYCFNISSCGK